MKKSLLSFLFFCLSIGHAQTDKSIDIYEESLYPLSGDSIPELGIRLDEVVLFQPLRFKSMDDLRNYVILRNRTLKVYPYAKLASDRLDTLQQRMENIKTKSGKKAYLKRIEKFIYDEFEEELKKLSRSQGKILIKLVHRQTGRTTHDLVKDLRNGWRAMIYQTTASFFDLSLKATYDPETNYEDFLIEDILQRAYADGFIELHPTALQYDIDTLYWLWKNKSISFENK